MKLYSQWTNFEQMELSPGCPVHFILWNHDDRQWVEMWINKRTTIEDDDRLLLGLPMPAWLQFVWYNDEDTRT